MLFIISTFHTSGLYAQQDSNARIVNSKQLYETLKTDMTNPLTRDFCQEITITVDIVIGEITTTILVCCSTEIFICMPASSGNIKNSNNEYPNDLEITSSASVIQNGYRISIVNGTYKLNKKGEVLGLKYKMVKI